MRGKTGGRDRPADDSARARCSVLLLGAGKRAERVANVIRTLGPECRMETNPTTALAKLGKAVQLVVIVPPLPDLSAENICRRIRGLPGKSDLPILVVGSPPRQAGRLYRAGVSGQFDWPEERTALVRTVLRLAAVRPDSPSREPRDVALSARVEERLLAERETFGPLVTSRVRRGIVILGGEVDAAWKIPELGRTLSSMPGVDEVVISGVRVPVTGIPDRVVSQAVRAILQGASGLDERTYEIRVSNGHVAVAGTASTRREMDRVVALIEQVEGVRNVENLVAISRPAKKRDRILAAMLLRLVRGQFPRSRLRVSVFGGVAVLGGKARDPMERRAIEALVSGQPGIERVVSKVG